MEKVGKVESLHDIIAEMETTENTGRASADCPSSVSMRSDARNELVTRDPLIKSQSRSRPEQDINKKAQPFRSPLASSSAIEGVCSPQVQAQNEHSHEQGVKDPPSPCGGPFETNIAKS